MAKNLGANVFQLIAFAFFFAYLFLPLAQLLINFKVFDFPTNLLLRNIFQASLSAALSIILGLPLAFTLIRKTAFSRILSSLCFVPMVLPQPVMILSLVLLFGNSGIFFPLFPLYGLFGIILAHVLYNFPLAAKIISAKWAALDDMESTARILGASKYDAFIHVTLPLLKNSIASAFIVVFAFSFTSFSIPLIFGGISNTTLEVEIFRTFFRDFDIAKGAFLSVLQIVVFLPVVVFWRNFSWGQKNSGAKKSNLAGILSIFYLVLFLLIFSPVFFKISAFQQNFTPIFNSLALAFISATLCILLWLSIGDKFANRSFILFGISPAVLAVSYFFLPYSFWLLPIGHALLSFALVSSILLPFSKSLKKFTDAASILGAGPLRNFLHIYLPLSIRPLLLAFSFSFAFSLGETAFLTSISHDFPTMSTALLQSFSTYRFSEGYFYCALLITISIIISFLIGGSHVFSSKA